MGNSKIDNIATKNSSNKDVMLFFDFLAYSQHLYLPLGEKKLILDSPFVLMDS